MMKKSVRNLIGTELKKIRVYNQLVQEIWTEKKKFLGKNVYIVIHRQTVSLYHNSLVWLDTQDALSWDRNPPNFTLAIYIYIYRETNQPREINKKAIVFR